MKKPVYALRKEDFIPIIGIKKHLNRSLDESWPHLGSKEKYDEYASQCFARDAILVLYNSALFIGTGFAVSGLVNLLSK